MEEKKSDNVSTIESMSIDTLTILSEDTFATSAKNASLLKLSHASCSDRLMPPST